MDKNNRASSSAVCNKPAAKVGLLTLGQTPRPELMESMRAIRPDVTFIMHGALDGLTPQEIAGLRKNEAAYPLMVRLADGTIHEIDMMRLYPYLLRHSEKLSEQGAQLSVLLCSAGFPNFPGGFPVIRPVELLLSAAALLSPRRRVSIINPIASQREPAAAYWQERGFAVRSANASPYEPENIYTAIRTAAADDTDLIVLDCMSFPNEILAEVCRITAKPVLIPQKAIQSFLNFIYM